MISLEECLAGLVRDGAITPEDARVRSARPDELDSLLRGSWPGLRPRTRNCVFGFRSE